MNNMVLFRNNFPLVHKIEAFQVKMAHKAVLIIALQKNGFKFHQSLIILINFVVGFSHTNYSISSIFFI